MAECPTCGKVTDTEQGKKIHHATVHDEPLTKNQWVCDYCDEEFTRSEAHIHNPDRVFCSNECKGKAYEGDINENAYITASCEWCGETFQRSKVDTEDRDNLFCSHECHGEWKLDKGSVTVTCEECGGDVVKNKYYAERTETHFCSQECQGNWYSENLVGENHPVWKGGYGTYYGPTWSSQRQKALERDGYECQDCGMTREEHYEEWGWDLEVHHQTPIRTFSDTAEANQLSNLVTLCKLCHSNREHS